MTLTPSPTVGGIRVSTEAQADKYGPDRQRTDIQREAERAGLHVTDWVEEAISGTDDERAAENRYYQLAREQPGVNVIFSHPNRVGRHVEVTVGIARRIHTLGGTVWIAGIGSLRDRRNWKEFLRDAVDAENDYTNIRYNLAAGQEDKARRGLWPHGIPPWGYTLERDARGVATLPKPVPELVPVLRRLFDLGERHGETNVLRIMQQEGWPAPTEAGWTRKTVHNLLTNTHYTGIKIFRGITVPFEAIITPEQFARVQAQREERRTHSSAKGTRPLLFTGHVRCATCDASLVRDVDNSRYTRVTGQRTHYTAHVLYRCWKGKRDLDCSNKRRWKEAELDALCWAELSRTLTQPDLLAKVATPPPAVPDPKPNARITELEAAIERAWRPFADGRAGYSESTAERLAAPYVTELEHLKRDQAKRPPPPTHDFETRAAEFKAILQNATTREQQRDLLHTLNVRIYIHPDGIDYMTLDLP